MIGPKLLKLGALVSARRLRFYTPTTEWDRIPKPIFDS
jgi:hypothetical protein